MFSYNMPWFVTCSVRVEGHTKSHETTDMLSTILINLANIADFLMINQT